MKRQVLAVAATAVIIPVGSAQADDDCSTSRCLERVARKAAKKKWRHVVQSYGTGLLHARMRCESGSDGGYSLATTGNGYWFSMQFNVGAWAGAGGRIRAGRPVGVWTRQPSKLEQQVRAVYWDRRHGGDPWPNCP